jgi:hypothetical protein
MPRLEEWPSSTEFGLQARLQFFFPQKRFYFIELAYHAAYRKSALR